MQALKHLNKYFIKYRGRFVAGVVFVAISNVFGIMPAKLIRYALDEAQMQIAWYRLSSHFKDSGEIVTAISFNLFIFALLVLLMALLKGLFMFFMRQTIIVASRHVEYDMKNEIYEHYQTLDNSFYSRNSTGDLMNRISEDVGRVRSYIGPAVMYTVNLVVTSVLVLYAMFQVDPKLTLITLIPLPILSVVIFKVEKIINRKSERVQNELSSMSTFVQETFSGIRVFKSYATEQFVDKEFRVKAEKYQNNSMDLVRVNSLFQPSLVLLIGLSTILTVAAGGYQVIRGEISVGNIAEFVIYVNMLTWPVAAIGWVVSLMQRAAASQERINEFLMTKPEIISGNHKPFAISGKVEFKNVNFTFPGSSVPALEGINFKVEAGKSLAITGRTGSGKSSVASLLLRFNDPTSGEILIDDQDLKSMNLHSYRSQIGFVPQEVFLFSDTIKENISFGLDSPDDAGNLDERIISAAKQAGVYDNIMEFPDGFETIVGERGITLSGGQKQRISIARAIVRHPSLLVFDDCLSAVDTVTEEKILNELKKVMEGKTTILISHRISTIKGADEILVLDEGKIIQRGTHEWLVKTPGLYSEMYEKQRIESEVGGN